ncbi:MAG: PL29 family lyase N-terminal domain-containing protein [Alistipes senegalensis]|nr:PL29 family lyase N-terminal domain-containing protein [Bacteroides cellulosilyticus]MCM1352459.1 PL29 family lyase N-terminal domain-containing protein [Alistipes senegalensis]
MKRTLLKTSVCALVALGAIACSDIDELRRDVDDLEHRVIALETQIQQLNSNVAALQTLMNGTTVNNVTEADGVYTVTLSNGEVLTLTQGSEGGYIEPKVAIDEDGYWIISVNNDGQFERMKDSEGNDVRAVAQDGKPGNDGHDGTTPKFRVDADNYWQVSYDGGTNWEYVLNGDQKVKADTAVGTKDPFFANVEVKSDKLVLTLLAGGTPYEIPIYAGFKCIISGASSVVEFGYNATKQFDVDMEGVETTIVTAPAGWTADLAAKTGGGGKSAYTLTVTAPASAGTRATADSRTDVSILAVAANGLSTIAKLRVNTTGTVLQQPSVTSVTVDATKTTETSLTFSVVTDDADGWKYICQPSVSAAPDAAKVMADGKAGTAGANTASSLTKNTAYTIYVVAYGDDNTPSALKTAEARTLKGVTDYYEAGVMLGGVTYDKNTSGVQLITAATTITANGVYFIDTEDEITLNKITATELVLIGRYSNKYPKVKLADTNTWIPLGTGTGFIVKNIEFDASTRSNYALNFNGGAVTCENLIFDNCKIITPENNHCSYFNNANAKINRVEVIDCTIRCKASAADKAMRIINLNAGAIGKTAKFHNSIIYAEEYAVRGCLLHVQANTTDMSTVDIDVTNCSFINYIGNPNGYLNLSNVHDVDFSKNILWANKSTETVKVSYVFKFIAASNQVTGALNYQDNLAYGFSDNTGCWKYFSTDGTYTPDTGNYEKESSDPFKSMDFNTGEFVPAVAGYGATIE